jgi:N-methylhydantoinase A/oxoprolinase/acetone carboxylase beta subunit
MSAPIRIGIDVGGTHTDAAVMQGTQLLGGVKSATTAPIANGILNAVDEVLRQCGLSSHKIAAVIIGTTQFTNAVIERKELAPVAAIRAGLPSGKALPPFIDWPDDLLRAVKAYSGQVHGGVTFDGRALSRADARELDRVIENAKATGPRAAVASSVFGPLDAQAERDIADAFERFLPAHCVVRSTTIGSIGLLERENAALLNASLLPFARHVTSSIAKAFEARAFSCPLFLTQNDGTLMDLETAARFPARTFASGPTNSLRGAALLSGERDAIVIDIGGTTSDVGVLKDGFARQSNLGVDVGGVRTNFRMPDILAIGLGGGSLVADDGTTLGPASVGYRLPQEGRVFGGDTLTATDIAVQDGALNIGSGPGDHIAPKDVVMAATTRMHDMLDDAIARMCGRDRKPVILVGGGSILVTRDLNQAGRVIRPENAGVANAVGASIAQASGEVDQVVGYRDTPRAEAIATAKAKAAQIAYQNGALKNTIITLDVEETPFSYTQNDATRLRVKAVGDLDFERLAK